VHICVLVPTYCGLYYLRSYTIMISQRLQSTPITGYYQYLSQIRHRVNVAPHEEPDNEEIMKQTTATVNSASADTVVNNNNGNKTPQSNSSSPDSLHMHSLNVDGGEVTRWSSNDVKNWVEQQCQQFELKKATSEEFQMNGMIDNIGLICLLFDWTFDFYLGQALVLLTKHDFLRRSPDGGEILYYALQRLISELLFYLIARTIFSFIINKIK
jgi:hypothetical protein